MTGAVSISAPTAAGVRAATAGTTPQTGPAFSSVRKVVTMQPAASPVVRSGTAGRALAGYSVSKLRVTGPICVVPTPAWLSPDRPIAPRSTHSAGSPARSATPGT